MVTFSPYLSSVTVKVVCTPLSKNGPVSLTCRTCGLRQKQQCHQKGDGLHQRFLLSFTLN